MKRLSIVLLAFVILGESAVAQRRGGPPPQGDAGNAEAGGGRGGGRGGRDPVGPGRTTGTSLIQGFVVAADTGAPVRRAEVRATSTVTRTARVASSDEEGRFALLDLPAGAWTVTVSKGGFVPQQFGQRRPAESVAPIQLAEGERRTITFSLWRGGAISGAVYDEFGDPITGARLQALRVQMADGQRRLVATGVTDQSDDRGTFRLYGLPPGDYYVSATARTASLPASDTARAALREAVTAGPGVAGAVVDALRDTLATVTATMAYAPTYFPGTPHASEAQRVSLRGPGEEANATFTLLPVRTVQVSGSIVTSAGAPASGAVALTPVTGGDIVGPGGSYSGNARADGSFTVSGVVPGAYFATVTTRGRGSSGEVALTPVTVGIEGVDDLVLTTGPGGSVAGTLVANGGTAPSFAGVQVLARAVRGGRSQQVTTRDGTFQLRGLVGPYTLDAGRVPQGWTLESIVINGVDVTDNPLEFRGTEQVTGARVTLTDRLTEITGTVSARGQQPPAAANVVIFPDDPARWALTSRFLRTARGDAQGWFSVQGLPPGSYLAVAVDYLQQGEFQMPEFLELMRSRATPFTIAPGGRTTLDLRLVER